MSIFFIFITFLMSLLLLSILWRTLSERRSIPCPTWLGWLVEVDNPLTKVTRAATIIKNSGIQEGMVVLDAGCGPGRAAAPGNSWIGNSTLVRN